MAYNFLPSGDLILMGQSTMPFMVPGLVPNTGKVFFVDGTNGSDSNSGTTPESPLLTLEAAYALVTGSKNEIIFVIGGSSAVALQASFAWNKSYTHLIGLNAMSRIGQRARITNGVTTNLMTPLMAITGSGCVFQNIEFYNGGDHATSAAVCLALSSGSRNSFINCQISGGGHATSAGNAAARSLTIAGPGGEHMFKHCYIGLDTVPFTAASSIMEFTAGTTRNVFEDCIFATYATGSGSGSFFGKIGADGIDRLLLFRDCFFHNASTFSGGVDLGNAFSLDAACGGRIILHKSAITGCTATAATKTCLFFDNVNGSTTTGKSLVAGW